MEKSGKREEEKEESETVTGKKRCEDFVSVKAFAIFCQRGGMESCGDVSWEPELCDVSPCCCDWELVEPQSSSFSKKSAHCCTDTQEDMRYEGSPVIAPPLTRRRMTPPTPVQNSYTSFVRDR